MHLSLRNAQLVVSTKEAPNEQHTVPIEDIRLVMIENQMVTATMPLLNALVDAGVGMILCDAKGMPHAMLQNMDGNNLLGECLRNQISMGEVTRKQLWKPLGFVLH
jgi:CRISPR-associated protein Cas1